jgi:hypothetical protein
MGSRWFTREGQPDLSSHGEPFHDWLADDAGVDRFVESVRMLDTRYYSEVIELFRQLFVYDDYRPRLQENLIETAGGFQMVGRVDYVITGRERAAIMARARTEHSAPTVVVPFMWSAKGSLFRDLHVTHGSTRVTVLSQSDVTALIGLAFEMLLRRTLDIDDATDLSAAQVAVVRRLGALIGIRDKVDRAGFLATFDKIVEPLHAPNRSFDRLRKLAEFFAQGYVLAAEVPLDSGCHIGVDYSFSALSDEQLAGGIRGLSGLANPNLGVRVPDSASLFKSYHLGVQGPAGSYARRAALYRGYDDGRPRRRLTEAEFVQEASQSDAFRRRQVVGMWQKLDAGSSNAHLHLNNYPPTLSRVTYGVRYEEVPPGGLPAIITMAFANALVAFVLATTVPSVRNSIDFNAPTLMLAIPIFAITVFGFSFDRLRRSSSASAIGYLLAAALTAFSTVLSVVGQPDQSRLSDRERAANAISGSSFLGDYVSHLGIARLYWPLLACAGASAALCVGLGVLLMIKTLYYRRWQRAAERDVAAARNPSEGARTRWNL